MGTGARESNDAGAAGTQDGSAGAGGNGGSGAAGEGGAGAGGSQGLDRTKLSPVLQNMNEDQINEVFDTMFGALKDRRNAGGGEEPDYSGIPRHARPVERQPDAQAQAQQIEALRTKYKKMMDPNDESYDPLTAMSEIAQLTVNPLLGTVNQRAIAGMLSAFRGNPEYPDFAEHEKEISLVLSKRDPATLTENDVIGTYYTVAGIKHIEEKKKAAKKPPTTVTPSPDKVKPPQESAVSKLDDTELSVARVMYRGKATSDEEAAKMYLDDMELEAKPMQVPIGGGKKA